MNSYLLSETGLSRHTLIIRRKRLLCEKRVYLYTGLRNANQRAIVKKGFSNLSAKLIHSIHPVLGGRTKRTARYVCYPPPFHRRIKDWRLENPIISVFNLKLGCFMKKLDKVEQFTPSVMDERIEKLKRMFPEFFTDGKLDVPKLREILGEAVEEETERYRFTWAGKRDAIQLLQTPTRATLIPCREESVEFDATGNIFIEGDNLEALKLLYKPYFGMVNAIYVDPPYNTGDDFVYRDNYTDPLHSYRQLTGQTDEEGKPLTTNVETSGRYHSDWMSMMYPRLFLARQLLSDDGLIFVSIDDNEIHNLRLMMNEIFGEENCIQLLVWQRHSGAGNHAKYCATDHEYILAYAKHLQAIDKLRRPLKKEEEAAYTEKDENYQTLGPYKTRDFESQEQYGGYTGHQYKIKCPDGSTILRKWRWKEQRFLQAKKENRIAFTQDEDGVWQVAYKLYGMNLEGFYGVC